MLSTIHSQEELEPGCWQLFDTPEPPSLMLRGINLRGEQSSVTFSLHPFSKLVKGARHGICNFVIYPYPYPCITLSEYI